MKNWVYYMQRGLQLMWKKKEVPDYRTVTDEVKFNKEGGVPKGHPFIDREWKGALKVTKDTIETPIDLTKDMSKEELTKYVEREWNGEKYQAGKK